MQNNRTILIVCLVIAVVLVGWLWFATHQNSSYQSPAVSTSTATSATSSVTTNASGTSTSKPSSSGTTGSHTGTSGGAGSPSSKPAPYLIKFVPAAGTPGTEITIDGTNFSRTANYITFGTSNGMHRTDGSADNVIATVASTDGTSVSFTVPSSGPSGLLCDAQNHCIAVSSMRLLPGTYPVTVRSANGTSNTIYFTLSQ